MRDQPEAKYPSRRVRRYLRRHHLTADFDFTAYFDQFLLGPLAQTYNVVRYAITEPDGSVAVKLMKLTRLPMGASQAPGIAQMFTGIICDTLMHIEGIRVYTMIDNIRIKLKSVFQAKY